MANHELVITKLEGYSGIRLLNNQPLTIKPGLNFLVGRNGSGKTNLLQLIRLITTGKGDINSRVEYSFFKDYCTHLLEDESFGMKSEDIDLVNFCLDSHHGKISIVLDRVPEKKVLKNCLKPGTSYQEYIKTTWKGTEVKVNSVTGSNRSINMELHGSLNSHLFSSNSDKHISSILDRPVNVVNEFVRDQLFNFFSSQQFIDKIRNLENSINIKLKKFLGTTNKEIKLDLDLEYGLSTSLFLMDGPNYIKSDNISTGESILLNLIFSLATEHEAPSDIVIFDEPELHMHDDMIQVFVHELIDLKNAHPSTKILIATHSTALIENLAHFGNDILNLITFDIDRNVSNSSKDIDLINALNRNGVWFSPLMLSKKPNIFIENQGAQGFAHRDFFLKFFSKDNAPNIIPIGNSGNVDQSDSFSGVFEDILKTTDLRSVGIQDGDIWLKPLLVKYLKGDLDLNNLVNSIKSNKKAYIQAGHRANQYYFNCWEIENLYLMDELLGCWKFNDVNLTPNTYRAFLLKHKDLISREYFDTFNKVITRIRFNKNASINERLKKLNNDLQKIQITLSQTTLLEQRMNDFIDAIFKHDLISWVPGKEIKTLLETEGYEFDDSDFNYENALLSNRLREMLV